MKKDKSEKLELAGKILSIVGNVFDAIINVLIIAAIAYVVYKGALLCYDYGYRIYTEEPVSAGTGKEVTVTVPVDFTAKEIGEIFEECGLTRDHILFTLQYYASEYRENVKGGTYTLSTAMTAEEMFESIADINIAKDEEKAALEEAAQNQAQEESDKLSSDDADTTSEDDTAEEDDTVQEIEMNGDADSLLEDDVR